MVTPAYLLDSSVCVLLLRGRTGVAELPAPPEAGISAIVAAELWAGAVKAKRARAVAALEQLLDFFPVLDFTANATRVYGEIRADLEQRGQSIGPLDLLIAAQARSLEATLVTRNARDFKRVNGLKVQAWK
ncbi:MAG: type II toxin-antitoxin system VapC family toxin [Chthoniobacterales bacterium]